VGEGVLGILKLFGIFFALILQKFIFCHPRRGSVSATHDTDSPSENDKPKKQKQTKEKEWLLLLFSKK
jgi:hypothetical protein